MIRFFSVVVICVIYAFRVVAQPGAIDSVNSLLQATTDPIKKVDILSELAFLYYDQNNEMGFNSSSEAYDLASSIGYAQGMRRARTLQGYYFFTKGDFKKALEFYRNAAAVATPEDDDSGYNLVMSGNAYKALAHYDSAFDSYNGAIAIFMRTKSDRRLAFAYKNMGRLFALQWKNDDAEIYFRKALAIYEQRGNKHGIADIWFALAEVSKNKSEFSKAENYVQDACDISHELNDEFLKIECLINQGNLKYRLGEFSASLKISFEAMGMLKSKDMPQQLAAVYSNIGEVYRGLGQNEVSLRYFEEALKIADRIGIKYELAKVYTSIGAIYKDQGRMKEAHEVIDRSLALRKEIRDEQGLSNTYSVRGLIYFSEQNYAQAIDAFKRSLEIRKSFNNREGISSSLFNLSQVYAALNETQKALALQVEALALEETMGNKFNIGYSNNMLGSIYTRLGMFGQAERHLKRARAITTEAGSNTLLMSNELNWSRFFEARGNSSEALRHYKRFAALRDSLYTDIGAQKLAELQALYQMQQKDQEIELLNREKTIHEAEISLQRARINQQTIIIIAIIVGLLLVSWLAIMTYRYNIRIEKAHREITEQKEEIESQSEELIEANTTIADNNKELEKKVEHRTQALTRAYKELDTFFYRASHDFRRPLTTFLGLAEVANVTVKDPNALELFDKVRETATNLDKMLLKLQSISDVGSHELVYKEVFLKEIFDNVCDEFRDELQRKGIKTSCDLALDRPFVSYPAMLKIIIGNMVENAIHFCGVDYPYIKLKAVNSGQYVTLDLQDNGEGIDQEYHAQVFDMYFRGSERSKGNGLGLYIVKKAVEKLDGSITLSSIAGSGTTFTIMLPNHL